VLRQPWIGMTRGFWRDEDGRRYHDAYWSHIPGLWVHGDFAAVDDDGQWFILGRSDDTIKVAGKRLGPSEVEAVLDGHPSVLESAAIGVPDDIKGEALVAFAVPGPGVEPTEKLRRELAGAIVGALGKALAPKAVYFVESLPRTRNAKVMRRVVRAAHLGLDPGDVSSLERPDAVEAVRAAS
jgi:acetyl-CoA synthetase